MSRHECFAGDGTVLERVLLAIINAHTKPGAERGRRERLDIAMIALLGDATPDPILSAAVDFMARQRRQDICAVEMSALAGGKCAAASRIRSVGELAMTAAREHFECADFAELNDAAETLGRLFDERHGKEPATGFDVAREAMETEAVQRLCAELAEWDVPTRL